MADDDAPPRRPRRFRWDVVLAVAAAFLVTITAAQEAAMLLYGENHLRDLPDFLLRLYWLYWAASPWVPLSTLVLLIAAIVVRLRTRER